MSATREELWRGYVDAYDIDVPQEAIANELRFIELDMRHRMQYDRLSGGDAHLFAEQELESQRDELVALATFEAKEPRVLKDLIARLGLTVTHEELEEEAAALARRQSTTVEAVRSFFGEDLAMLERDVLDRKAIDWALAQDREGRASR